MTPDELDAFDKGNWPGVSKPRKCRYCGGKLSVGTDLKETNLVIIRCQDCGRINEAI